MDVLLSGFVGALIATLITVIYLYISEQIRRRFEVTLDAIGYTDELYNLIQIVIGYKDSLYTRNIESMSIEEYQSKQRKINSLVTSFKIIAKVRLVYGEYSIELLNFHKLMTELQKIPYLLWETRIDTWKNDYKKIMDSLEDVIDPLRRSMHVDFLRSTNLISVIKSKYVNLIRFYNAKKKSK